LHAGAESAAGKFSVTGNPGRGLSRHLARTKKLERRCHTFKIRETPDERCRVLPGDPEDSHSRYIEANVNGIVIGCLYLPNGNPAPGPKFDYKLKWLERLTAHAAELFASDIPVVLTGDYNVIPTEIDVYKPERWVKDALFRPDTRAAFHNLMSQGWTDAIRKLYPNDVIYTFLGFLQK
jgi:exodeoxyribonuclease-3